MWPKPLKLVLSVTLLVGILAALFPFVPRVEEEKVIQTEMRRFDHVESSDFAGEFEGAVALRGGPERGVLTMTGGGEGRYTSPPIDLTLTASSIAAHWTQRRSEGSHISFAIRSSAYGTTWTDWETVEGEGGVAGEEGVKVFGNLVATAGARYAQYRIALATGVASRVLAEEGMRDNRTLRQGWAEETVFPALAGVTLFAFDSATPPVRSSFRLALVPRDRALATIKPLNIVSRKEWGADESLRFEVKDGQPANLWPEEVRAVEKIVVHHTAGPNVCASPESYCQRQSVLAINDIYYYHAVVNGWGDIGYNSLIGYDGRIYEGRHGPEPDVAGDPLEHPVVAGHALGHNRATHGIALMGDFQHEDVPDLQYDSLAKMVGWIVQSGLAAEGKVDPLGFSAYLPASGKPTPPLPNIIGHRDVNDTECPGTALYEKLIELRHLAERLVAWPPVLVTLRAMPQGDAIAYHIFVDNHEPSVVRRLTIKGAVPENAELVDSWAGSPYQNRGVFDGSVVTWHDPDAGLSPGTDRREYVLVIRPRPGVSRGQVETTAWVEFAEPAPGVAMSGPVSADQSIDIVADAVTGGVRWVGEWPVSRNVRGYYGDAYQIHEPDESGDTYTWEAELPEAGVYEVLAWWTAAADRATSARYAVSASDGTHEAVLNQRQRGAQWVSLGSYQFAKGTARVTLEAGTSGVAIADAVRFRKAR